MHKFIVEQRHSVRNAIGEFMACSSGYTTRLLVVHLLRVVNDIIMYKWINWSYQVDWLMLINSL
jgi:hypothetical protein